jgi:hypothetical protein
LLDQKETKNQGCTYFAKIMLHSAKEKELASLKQLFLFNAPFRIISLRKIHEAGPCSWVLLLVVFWSGVAFASLGLGGFAWLHHCWRGSRCFAWLFLFRNL